MTKSEPTLNEADGALRAPQARSSGGAGRKEGLGEMNARAALASAAKFRANEVGAPRSLLI